MNKLWISPVIFLLITACGLSTPAPLPAETKTATVRLIASESPTKLPSATMRPTATPTFTDTATALLPDTPTFTPSYTATQTPPVTPTPGLAFTPADGACTITATGTVSIFYRPSGRADPYGYLNPGNTRVADVYTLDGFIGFDPGVRHPEDIGIFRERWVWMNASLYLQGNCDILQNVVGPFPGVCYAVAGNDTRIYRTASTASDLETTMHYGDYVKAIGRKGNWVEVDSSVGSLYLYRIGWIMSNQFIPNGPCSSLHVSS